MEAFVFDRSAIYSSGSFDVRDQPERFCAAMVSMEQDLSIVLASRNNQDPTASG